MKLHITEDLFSLSVQRQTENSSSEIIGQIAFQYSHGNDSTCKSTRTTSSSWLFEEIIGQTIYS